MNAPHGGMVSEGARRGAAAAALAVFALFALLNAWKPASSDEHWFVIAAKDYALAGGLAPWMLIHPPLYTLVNGTLLGFFGGVAALKLWGAALGAGSLALLYAAGAAGGEGRVRPLLAVLLAACAPLFIQGAVLLDTDNTLVAFFLLAMLLALLKERWPLFTAAFLLCLWSKLTACVPVLAVLGAWGVWRAAKGDRSGPALLVSLGSGLALFLATFWLFCRLKGLPFGMPFAYLYGSFFMKRVSGGGGIALQAAQFLLWTGLPFALLWAASAVRVVKAGAGRLDLLAAGLSAAMGAGYVFVGGTPFGFPKFQVPAFLLGCWLVSAPAAAALEELRARPLKAALLAAGGAALLAAAGDPVYTLRFLLRGALAAGQSAGPAAAVLALQALAPAALAGVFWFLAGRPGIEAGRRAAAALCLACASQFLAMDLMQAKGHNTLYTYGVTGITEAADTAAEALAGGGGAALPLELTGYLRLKGFALEITPNPFWSDQAALEKALTDPGFKVLAYGAPFNTLDQMRVLTGPRTAAALAAGGWRERRIGAYSLWTRGEK